MLLFYFDAVPIHIRVSRRSCAYARDAQNEQLPTLLRLFLYLFRYLEIEDVFEDKDKREGAGVTDLISGLVEILQLEAEELWDIA